MHPLFPELQNLIFGTILKKIFEDSVSKAICKTYQKIYSFLKGGGSGHLKRNHNKAQSLINHNKLKLVLIVTSYEHLNKSYFRRR